MMPENTVASNFVAFLLPDISEVLCRPGGPALLEVRGQLHDAEALLAVGANGPRVDLLE